MRVSVSNTTAQALIAAAGALVTIGAVYYAASRLKSAVTDSAIGQAVGATWDAGNTVADVATAPVATAWERLKALLNGTNIKFSRAEIYLNPKYFDNSGKINAAWMDAMSAGHPDIKNLFRKLLDSTGRVKPEYRKLIGGILNEGAL